MRKTSKTADPSKTRAKSGAKTKKRKPDLLKDVRLDNEGGEGSKPSRVASSNKLIQPQKKCHKGGNKTSWGELLDNRKQKLPHKADSTDDWAKIIERVESNGKPPFRRLERYSIPEHELAWRMGLPRQWLRNMRKKDLTEGKDWVTEGNAVILLHTAIETILRQLNLTNEDIPEEEAPRLFKITKFWANPRIIGCIDPDPEAIQSVLHSVWVRDSSLFNMHQLIPVYFKRDKWVLACRQPKKKGKILK